MRHEQKTQYETAMKKSQETQHAPHDKTTIIDDNTENERHAMIVSGKNPKKLLMILVMQISLRLRLGLSIIMMDFKIKTTMITRQIQATADDKHPPSSARKRRGLQLRRKHRVYRFRLLCVIMTQC